MSYVNADDVLPECLIWEIQKYIDGQIIYIPRKDENTKSWGEKNGTKDRLAERNQKIVELLLICVSYFSCRIKQSVE